MNKRPKRSIKPPSSLKEYVVVAELVEEDVKETYSNIKLDTKKNLRLKASLLKCKKCNVKCKNKTDLVNHLKIHGGKDNYLCEDCGKSLSSYQAFSEHINIHKNIKPYSCEVCGHQSRQISVHSRHMLTHEENPIHTFQCSVCSKPFKVKEYLKQHMRKHIGEKPYDCDLCSKSFSAKNELNRHKISHSSARPFSCEHCGKKFKLKHNLTAHIKSHTGMQLFKCCLCKASFPQQCLMEKHKKSHTEVIQHLELVKTDPRTLTITSFPLDRRKVLHHQKVCLPPKLDLNDSHNASNSRVSLGLNDAFIPISVIANSFGTGNYIKMKIVDQIGPKNESARKFPDMSGVTNAVLVDEDSMLIENAKEEESAADSGHSNESKENVLEDSKTECSQTDPQSRFSSHFEVFEKTFNLECLDEAKLAWLQVLSDVVREFEFPLHYSVCQQLHLVTTKLQKILITHSLEEKPFGSTLDLHAPSCESCHLEEKKKKEPLSDFPKPLNVKDEPKTLDKPKLKVELCDSEGIGRDQLKRGRLKLIHKFYLHLSEVLQKHFKISLK